MPVSYVWLHESFYNGETTSDYFIDFSYLSDDQIGLIEDFSYAALRGSRLSGRNKRSWVDRNGNDVPTAQSYKSSHMWHYHAGPHDNSKHDTENVRTENLGQQTSDSVIHYCWRGENEIVILAFSPKHERYGFPKVNDKQNVLRSRIRIGGKYPSDKLVNVFFGYKPK